MKIAIEIVSIMTNSLSKDVIGIVTATIAGISVSLVNVESWLRIISLIVGIIGVIIVTFRKKKK